MTTRQKAISFLYAGLILLLGTVGGIEVSPDLATADGAYLGLFAFCLLYTSPSPRDRTRSRMPSSA